MGGLGSGRYAYASTPTVEECRSIDADMFTDVVDAPSGSYIDLTWSENANIRAYVENTGAGEHVEALRLTYTTRPDTDDARTYEYRVPFDYTEPNYGGVRPWFRCPKCGTRRRKLYLPPRNGRFLCRECYDLGYRSSRTSGDEIERAEQRYRKAFAKADAEGRRPHPDKRPYTPERPKGMHHDTFEELLEDVHETRDEWGAAFHRRLLELAWRTSVSVPPGVE